VPSFSTKKFVNNLKNYESPFIINPYDPCVANATIAGLQMTVTWHIDDLKISHVEPYQITKFSQYLACIYGNGLVVHQGKLHKYLGMDLNFALDRIVQVSTIAYTTKVISDFPKSITTSCCHMMLNLSANNLTTICWWVDASHATHDNCHGLMGAMMSLGKGATISFSNKLKITTKSSTESELVGADQAPSSILHTRYFIEAQGYSVEQNILYQDNQPTMRLEVNDSFSSLKQTKHIKCRYSFIRDKLDNSNLKLVYCPTKIKWAHVLTKPKQGSPFPH
jgi:hypothetical protein